MKRFLLPAMVLCLTSVLAAQAKWEQWRGPGGAGVSAEVNLPEAWGPHSAEVLWQVAVPGRGHSSPIVSNGKVFLTTAVERMAPDPSSDPLIYLLAALGLLLTGYLVYAGWVIHLGSGTKWGGVDSRWIAIATVSGLAASCLVGITEVRNLFFLSVFGLSTTVAFGWILTSLRQRVVTAGAVLALGAALYMAGGKFLVTEARYLLPIIVLFAVLHSVSVAAADAVTHAPDARRGPGPAGTLEQALTAISALAFVVGAILTLVKPQWFWIAGLVWPIWKVSGIVASLGLLAATAALPRRWIWALVGAGILVAAAVCLIQMAPQGETGARIGLERRILPAVVGLAAAAWFLALLFKSGQGGARRSRPRISFRLSAAAVGGMAVLYFLLMNFYQVPRLQRMVLAFELSTGKALWQRVVMETALEAKHKQNTYASPTPATDGRVVVADFGWGLACLDQDGKILWEKQSEDYSPHSMYGAASSPVISGNRVFVMQDSERPEHLWDEAGYEGQPGRTGRPTRIIAYNLADGAEAWKVERTDTRDSYSTPLVVSQGSGQQLITATAKKIISYDAASGTELWSQETTIPQVGTSPVYADGVVWLGAGAQHVDKGRAVVAVRIPQPPERPRSELLWQSNSAVPTCSSPVIVSNKLYTLSYNGILTAYDAFSGAVECRKRLGTGEFFSSLLVADGKLYASNDGGTTIVVSTDGKCEALAENQLSEGIYASPAVAEGRLLIRTTRKLICLKKVTG